MSLVINNTSASPLTIQNTTINAGSSYTVPSSLEKVWANDPTLTQHINTGDCNVGDGINFFLNSSALSFLKEKILDVFTPVYTGSYILPISTSPSLLTNGTIFWAMRNNTSGNRMFLQKLVLTLGYGGLTNSLTPSKLSFQRFSGGTPTGGSAISAIKADSGCQASNLLDARQSDNGLGMNGVIIESSTMPFNVISQSACSTTINLLFPLEHELTLITLNPGEGLCLSATAALVSGLSITGFVQWVERA